MSANESRSIVIADRPTHGEPRPYQFPRFEREELSNGLGLIAIHLPGRALVLTKLRIHGEDVRRNMFGYRRLRWLAQAVMEVMDVDELRIEGEVRTTGAGPGHRPRALRFARAVRPPD